MENSIIEIAMYPISIAISGYKSIIISKENTIIRNI
jgi:hypothetical protein